MDSIQDHNGVEFIVEDYAARSKLVNFFRENIRGGGQLESFKESGNSGSNKRSSSSNKDFDCVKFVIRVPCPVEAIPPYAAGEIFERITLEVQIFTVEGHYQRLNNPDTRHEAYKRRQFDSVFPIWFPEKVYRPLLESLESKQIRNI